VMGCWYHICTCVEFSAGEGFLDQGQEISNTISALTLVVVVMHAKV
jgi:hypothetical protein